MVIAAYFLLTTTTKLAEIQLNILKFETVKNHVKNLQMYQRETLIPNMQFVLNN